MINHATKTLNREYPNISVLMQYELCDSFHKGIRVIKGSLICSGIVHYIFRIEYVEFDNEIGHQFKRKHYVQFILLILP